MGHLRAWMHSRPPCASCQFTCY